MFASVRKSAGAGRAVLDRACRGFKADGLGDRARSCASGFAARPRCGCGIGRQWLAAGPGIFRAGGAAPYVMGRGPCVAPPPHLGRMAAGLVLAVLAMVPLVNFFAPLFGAAFMVHVYKRYVHEERPVR